MEDSNVKEKIITIFDKSYIHLTSLWKEVGLTEFDINTRKRIIIEQIQELFDSMIEEEEDKIGKIKENIAELATEIYELSNSLNIEVFDPDEKLPLIALNHQFDKKLEELRSLRDIRLKELNNLRKIEEPLCNYLDMPILTLQRSIPASDDLAQIKQHIEMLESEKIKRQEKFKIIKEQILEFTRLIDVAPKETKMLFDDIETIPMSKDNLKILCDIRDKYEVEYEVNYLNSEELKEKIKRIWKKLNISDDYQHDFLANHTGYSTTTIEALKRELKDCEQKKREHLEEFIRKSKIELDIIWDQCLIGPIYRKQFNDALASLTLEEVLNKYEYEHERVVKYYAQCMPIFKKLSKWQELFSKMQDFTNQQRTPARLNNRGGTLLKEEKERNRVYNLLPKIQEEVIKMVTEYCQNNENEIPLIYDQNIADYIEQKWQSFNQERENLKLERIHLKSKLTPIAPLSAKRKQNDFLTTPNCSKRLRLSSERSAKKVGSKVLTPQIPASQYKTITPLSSKLMSKKRRSTERKKLLRSKYFNDSIVKTTRIQTPRSSEITYTKFKHGLSDEENLHSTVATPASPKNNTKKNYKCLVRKICNQ